MTIRFQPLGEGHPGTFGDLKASPMVRGGCKPKVERYNGDLFCLGSLQGPGDVQVRACHFDPSTGLGAFVTAPLAKRISGGAAQVGRVFPGTLYGNKCESEGDMAHAEFSRRRMLWMPSIIMCFSILHLDAGGSALL